MRPVLRLVWAGVIVLAAGSAAQAQTPCGSNYTVQPGDTLFSIAEAVYGDYEQWALIYYDNQALVLAGPLSLTAGAEISIPCPASATPPDPTPLQSDDAGMVLLTGSNYPPFTERTWPGEGMITELVNAILEASPNPVPYRIEWDDDWSQHLFPKLDKIQDDMGFPWLKPDCLAEPANERCANFHFSDPLFVMPIQLFVRADAGFAFEQDSDIEGKTLCRPKGYYTHDLDANGRNWLKDGKITLIRGDSPDACFAALMAGEVDAVPESLFLGGDRVVALGLRGKVVPIERPLSSETLHVIISKKHWRGTTHLYRVNAGLAAIKASGRYDEIVNRHLRIYMENLNRS